MRFIFSQPLDPHEYWMSSSTALQDVIVENGHKEAALFYDQIWFFRPLSLWESWLPGLWIRVQCAWANTQDLVSHHFFPLSLHPSLSTQGAYWTLFNNHYGNKLKTEQICCLYVITESGACTLTTSTKLQNKYRSTLYQHEIKEKRRLLPILSSPISLT